MKKNNNKKNNSFHINKLFPVFILIITMLMSIGYASINSIYLEFGGEVIAKDVDQIYMTDVNYISNVNADLENSKILNAYQTNLNSSIVLSDVDENSSITYEITILNSTNDDYAFEGVNFLLGEDTYDNQDITYKLDGLDIGYILSGNKSVTFTITFYYKDNVLSDNNVLNSALNFRFERYIESSITFDYNYLPGDHFEELYDTTTYRECCESGPSSFIKSYSRDVSSEGITYTITRYPLSTTLWDVGFYFPAKVTSPLPANVQYTLVFEARGSENFDALIGSEQGGYTTFNITTEYKRYSHTFISNGDEVLPAFVVYYWGIEENERTLEIRNAQIHDGELYTVDQILRAEKSFGSLPEPTRSGWIFVGWFTDPIGGEQITNDSIVPVDNTTYYAHWEYDV